MGPELFKLHADREVRHWWFVGRRKILRALVHELIPPGEGRLIVDVGCGTGANVAALAGEYECVGIDVSPEGIALAREHYPNNRFIVGYAPEDLGDLTGRADLFLMMDVLEHVRDDVGLFTRVMAAAKPGAHVIVTVPADPKLWSAHDVTHMHYRRYVYDRLRVLWEGDPVTPLLVTGLNRRLLPVVRLVRALENRRGRTVGPGRTDLSMPPAPLNGALSRVLAGETGTTLERLRRRVIERHPSGVSFLVVARREHGVMTGRERAPELAASDLHDPERTS
jgi:SAM-dependent methyltransferase